MITVIGPDWPTTRSLRAALAEVPEVGSIHWGQGAGDKLSAFSRLRAGGVYSPLITTSLPEAEDWARWGLTVWGRKLRHTQGKDIARFNTLSLKKNFGGTRWRGRDFWVQVLPSIREWRVHVWDGVAFRTGTKQFTLPDRQDGWELLHLNGPDNPAPVRSDRCGWQLCYSAAALDAVMPDRKPLRETAKAACVALGIKGGAVDILEGTAGQLTVLEVNTAPALGELTLAAYVEKIRKSFRQ